tara:strand:- start:33 stop:467 length:435 start_codon:yes stop_codon:yes gene_type:complete
MRKPTGQMQELTQKKLDEYNELYDWSYNDMCDFIESYGEEAFVEHYDTYYRLCDDYSMELVDNFANHFDVDTIPHFEEMYQGQHETGANFAENICEELGYIRDLPPWVAVDWEKTWEDALSNDYVEIDCDMSDYTYGHIFSNNY